MVDHILSATELGGLILCGQHILTTAGAIRHPAPLEAAGVAILHHRLAEILLQAEEGILVHLQLAAHVVLGQQHRRRGVVTLGGGSAGVVGVAVATDQVQIQRLKHSRIVGAGGDGAGDLGCLFLHRLVDDVQEVLHIVLGHAPVLTAGKVVAQLAVIGVVILLVGQGDERHHVGVLCQHLAQRLDKPLGVMLGHGGVAIHLRDHIPRLIAPIHRARGGMEANGPHHRHTDVTAHIQQAANVVDILLLDAQHVAVFVIDDALAVDGAAIGQHIVAQRLQVVDLTIDLVGTIGVDAHGGVVTLQTVVFGHHFVGGQGVTQVLIPEPGIPHAIDQAVPLQDLVDQRGLLQPRQRLAEIRQRRGRHTHQQRQCTQHRQKDFCQFLHLIVPLVKARSFVWRRTASGQNRLPLPYVRLVFKPWISQPTRRKR